MGRASRRKKERRLHGVDPVEEVVKQLISDSGPLIDAARSPSGHLTLEELQGALDEGAERYNVNLFDVSGPQRRRCISLLVELCSLMGNDEERFSQRYAQIDPDSTAGLTPAAIMGVAASNLDGWLGPEGREVPDDVVATFDQVWSSAISEEQKPAGDGVLGYARQGALVPNITQLVGGFGGENILGSMVAAVAALSSVWSASTDEYHDDLLMRVMK